MLRRFVLTAVLFTFLSWGRLGYAEPLEMREVRIQAAVSPSFQALPSWRADFEKRLGYASRIFENQFKIKFRLIRCVKWIPSDEAAELNVLLDDLRDAAPLSDVDMVIGLMHAPKINPKNARNLHTIGQARPFSGHLVIRYPMNPLMRVQEETVLVHELGHAFGAVHTEDANSIMSPVVDRQLPVRFDQENQRIILQTRNLNFKKGPESLPPNVLQGLLKSYLKLAMTNESSDFFYSLGLFYLQLNQPDDAVKAWKMAVSLDMDNAELHYHLGSLYFKTGQYDLAVAELSHAVSGLNLNIQKPMRASALTMLGEAYYEQDNLFAAYHAWTKAAAIRPQDLELQANLAMIQIKQGQSESAIETFEKILKKNPRHTQSMIQLGLALNRQGKSKEALDYLELALTQLNREPRTRGQVKQLNQVYGEIGGIEIKAGKKRAGLQHYQAACDLMPSADCHRRLGMILFQEKLWSEAAGELAQVLQFQKDDADIYGYLGTALAQKGDSPNALAVFREGLRYAKTPAEQARLHRNIGNLFVASRHYDLAEPEFRLALAKVWNDPENHFGLAVTLLGSNQPVGAVESLKNVLRFDPKNQRAKTLLQTVENNLKENPSYA